MKNNKVNVYDLFQGNVRSSQNIDHRPSDKRESIHIENDLIKTVKIFGVIAMAINIIIGLVEAVMLWKNEMIWEGIGVLLVFLLVAMVVEIVSLVIAQHLYNQEEMIFLQKELLKESKNNSIEEN